MEISGSGSPFVTCFNFGDLKVEILQGNILKPGVDVQALVSTDDNYLTMGSGFSATLRKLANSIEYVREAQKDSPIIAGSVVVTASYGLKDLLKADYVIHGAVIDYDTYALNLADLVEQTTQNCLKQAEALGVKSILFPALATGAGKLSMEVCALRMCCAIKEFVAQERRVKDIYIMLYLPEQAPTIEPAELSMLLALNEQFIREANLVLGVPYDPQNHVRQVRDFYGGGEAFQKLVDIIVGKKDDENGRQHAVILGGPFVGKWTLLDFLYYQSKQPGNPLGIGRRLVRLTFGRVHESTPASFVYRKFLKAFVEAEQESGSGQADLLKDIKETYSDPELDCDKFLAFLDRHQNSYSDVVFLIDKLPRLLRMEAKGSEKSKGFQDFWQNLDSLQKYIRIIYTARPEDYKQLRDLRLEPYTDQFKTRIDEIYMKCVKKEEREAWVNDLFSRYLGRNEGAPRFVHDTFEEEAGRHPYLISLFGYELISVLKRDLLTHPGSLVRYTRNFMMKFLQSACASIEEPRRNFFDLLISISDPDDRAALELLAKAIGVEDERITLIPDLQKNDPNAVTRWKELLAMGDLRSGLNQKTLAWLEKRGYLVDTDTKAQFMAKSFASWTAGLFGVDRKGKTNASSIDVEFSFLGDSASTTSQVIRTMFRDQGARIATAQKEMHPDDRLSFMEEFGSCVSHLMHPTRFPETSWLKSPEEVGNYVLTQFTTSDIKRFLQNPALESTVVFNVDEGLKDIPWELILETSYAGEIPFRTGRRIIGQQPANINPVVRGRGKIKALLIGDPDQSLPEARGEVENLAERLRNDERFEEPDMMIGPQQCQRGPILSALGSGKYGLIHYSGHSMKEGYHSAWVLAKGQTVTTDQITSALQMGPPAFMFSSSCESAAAEALQSVIYENQTFDLPSAVLQAGVEEYVGTLWEVDSLQARRFVEVFYDNFLSGDVNLGECVRRARWSLKQTEEYGDQVNWLSFILYGDPHRTPADLYPLLKGTNGAEQ